jgi:hypothetical protein
VPHILRKDEEIVYSALKYRETDGTKANQEQAARFLLPQLITVGIPRLKDDWLQDGYLNLPFLVLVSTI